MKVDEIKEKVEVACDKWIVFTMEHPYIYYGSCLVLGASLGLAYRLGFKKGANEVAKGMLVIARAATDDETFDRIIKTGNMRF